MNGLRLFIDSAVLSAAGLTLGDRIKKPLLYTMGLIYMTLEVYFIYRGQENSDLFFWHGYLAWSVANLAFVITRAVKEKGPLGKRLLWERIALWQLVVVTVFAGFSLCVGWLMKLYIR